MEPNFIIVEGADPLSYLWRAFPELRTELDNGDSETYCIYARFADHLASHRQDAELWRRSYDFFERLAAGGGSLADVLTVGVFESLCDHPELVQRLRSNLGPLALKQLEEMG
jgi:hypothetical protein